MLGRAMRLAATAAAAVGLAAAGTLPAQAGSGGGWQPVGPIDPVTTTACRTTLTITTKVNEVETRTVRNADGDARTDYRGRYVVKVTAPDGRRVTLDNSGNYTFYQFADGTSLGVVRSPALIYPFSDDERTVFTRAGLPPVFYYTKGRLDLHTDAQGKESVVTTPKDPVSICRLLH